MTPDSQEVPEFTPVGRWSQIAIGVFLLTLTAFADVFAVRDFVWLFERVRLDYVEPGFSAAVLAMTPWLGVVSYRLLTGAYEHRDLLSPTALILLGVGLCVVTVLGARSGFFEGRALYVMLVTSSGAVSLGWYRARRR